MGVQGHVASKMLIMNCRYDERPNFVKKRYFWLMTMLGLSTVYRNGLSSKLHEANFSIEKHIDVIDASKL